MTAFHDVMADGRAFLQNHPKGAACGMVAHGSPQRVDGGNDQLAADGPRAWLYDMERQCREQADFLVSPAPICGLDARPGLGAPARASVIPNSTAPLAALPPRRADETAPPREIVFFGRLEERKGLRVFCDALARPPLGSLPGG